MKEQKTSTQKSQTKTIPTKQLSLVFADYYTTEQSKRIKQGLARRKAIQNESL